MKKFHIFLVIVTVMITSCKTNRKMRPDYVHKCPTWDTKVAYSGIYKH